MSSDKQMRKFCFGVGNRLTGGLFCGALEEYIPENLKDDGRNHGLHLLSVYIETCAIKLHNQIR